jgi:hypothetical protein
MNYDIDTEDGMANSVAWTEELFLTINNGGKWIVPRSGTTIEVHHKYKTVYITEGHTPDSGIERVIDAMGWRIKYK